MDLNWFVMYLNDLRKLKYLKSALSSSKVKATIWSPLYKDPESPEHELKPLFPGYIFLGVNPSISDLSDKVTTSEIGSFLKRPGSVAAALLSEEEVNHIKSLEIEGNKIVDIKTPLATFKVDQFVEIHTGYFAGTAAQIKEVKGRKVVVEMSVFQRVVSVELPAEACRAKDA